MRRNKRYVVISRRLGIVPLRYENYGKYALAVLSFYIEKTSSYLYRQEMEVSYFRNDPRMYYAK